MPERAPETTHVQRRDQRFAARFTATAIVDRVQMLVEIADISRVGACLRGFKLPQHGEELVLRAIGLEVVATVVWREGQSCGVTFHKPIAPQAVLRKNPNLPSADTLMPAVTMRI